MKLDKKQTVQLAVLGVLAVACIGYLSFKIMGPKPQVSDTGHKATSSAKASALADDRQAEPEATITPETPSVGVFPDLASLPARRDPFVAQRLPMGEVVGSTLRPPKYVPKLLSSMKGSAMKVPPIDLKPVNPFGTQARASVQPVTQVKEDPEEAITVTGVVRGESNVVIIRVGQTGRHVVKEGQTIDGRYKVASVTDDGAVLVYKNRHIPVKLGGAKNAK